MSADWELLGVILAVLAFVAAIGAGVPEWLAGLIRRSRFVCWKCQPERLPLLMRRGTVLQLLEIERGQAWEKLAQFGERQRQYYHAERERLQARIRELEAPPVVVRMDPVKVILPPENHTCSKPQKMRVPKRKAAANTAESDACRKAPARRKVAA